MQPSNHPLHELLISAQHEVPIGAVYTHYKSPDRRYVVIGHAIWEATGEPAIIYQAQYGRHLTFARSLAVWRETVIWQGKSVPRFTIV